MEKQVSGKGGLLTPAELDAVHQNAEIARLKAENKDLRERLAIPGLHAWKMIMEKQVSGKGGLFTEEELDVLICALIRHQTEMRSRLPIMERFASALHLVNHRAKIALGEQLLKDLST